MSPRAAWRLVMLGYDAYDYVAGKQDWLSFDLPYEGDAVLAGRHLSRDVPRCGPRDRLGEVRDRLEASAFGTIVVVNDADVVLGRLDHTALDAQEPGDVGELMYEGPTTVRPSEPLESLVERMRRAEVQSVLVTRSDGTLLGVLQRSVGERVLAESQDAAG